MKYLHVLLLSLCVPLLLGAAPSRTYTYVTGQTVDPSQVTTNEDNIFAYLQAGVDTYAVGSIGTAALADSAVTAAKISDGTIANADVSTSAAIAFSKLATLADDSALIGNSSSVPTATTVTNCTDTGGNHLNYTQSTNAFSCGTSGAAVSQFVGSFTRDTTLATGTQAVTGVGFTPQAVIVFMTQGSSTEGSWGFTDGTRNQVMIDNNLVSADTYDTDATKFIYDIETGANQYAGALSSMDADGFTVSWTKLGTPAGTITCKYIAIR